MSNKTMKQIIDGKQYDTETAEQVASDHYWDGNNWDRHGRSTYLYKTKKGAFFVLHETRWQGERDNIEAVSIDEAKRQYEAQERSKPDNVSEQVSIDEAKRQYEALPEHDMEFAEAFGEEPEEA